LAKIGIGNRSFRAPQGLFAWRGLAAAAAALAGLACGSAAFAQQSAECARLQAAIASVPHGGGGQYAAAAERQRAELARTNAYARSIGCDNQKFLFFGSEPPAQCGEIKGQIARMQASLADLQGRAGGGGGRAELIARYNAECGNAPRQPSNIFEALFGGLARVASPDQPVIPASPEDQEQTIGKTIENEKKNANVSAGSYAVCVRTCDGSFFPVSYQGVGRVDNLEEACRSLCPNADVALYSFPFGGTIDEAVSPAGERYVDLPNSLKFQQTFDSSCSCRRKGESWSEALAAAEARYGHEAHDILVTPEKSLELSRPIVKAAADAKTKPSKSTAAAPAETPAPAPAGAPSSTPSGGATALDASPSALDANGAETALSAAAANVSREASGIAGGDAQSATNYNQRQGQTVTESGPDGVTRKVRIVGPTL
jgi:hypothetical protein